MTVGLNNKLIKALKGTRKRLFEVCEDLGIDYEDIQRLRTTSGIAAGAARGPARQSSPRPRSRRRSGDSRRSPRRRGPD